MVLGTRQILCVALVRVSKLYLVANYAGERGGSIDLDDISGDISRRAATTSGIY